MDGNDNNIQYQHIEKLFTKLYEGVDTGYVSREDRKNINTEKSDFVYGEVEFPSFSEILKTLKLENNQVFYDLGCGGGKAVFIAALNHRFSKVCGIEFLPNLCKLAEEQLTKLTQIINSESTGVNPSIVKEIKERISHVNFINNDILRSNFDDADVVFISATCFSPELWSGIVTKLTGLKVGAQVIVLTKRIDHPDFKSLYHEDYQMSWGMNSVNAYEKIA